MDLKDDFLTRNEKLGAVFTFGGFIKYHFAGFIEYLLLHLMLPISFKSMLAMQIHDHQSFETF